jgi:hypothetical protein
MQRVLGPGMSIVPDVAVGGDPSVAFKVAGIAAILTAGVIVGAALLIRRNRKGQS